jgi:hypothetical protein
MSARLLVLFSVALLGGCGSTPARHTSHGSSAKKLMEAWRGAPVPSEDPNVAGLQRHLASLRHRCRQTEAAIARKIETARKILGRTGRHESPLALAAAMDTLAYSKTGVSDCSSLLGSLIVLLESETPP